MGVYGQTRDLSRLRMLSMAWHANRCCVYLRAYVSCRSGRICCSHPNQLHCRSISSECDGAGSRLNQTAKLFPVDTSLESTLKRDVVLRNFILGQSWNLKPEYLIMRNLLMRPFMCTWAVYADRYPFIFDYEWMVPISGKLHVGDVLFADGCGRFLAVEAKSVLRGPFAVGSGRTLRTRRNLAKRKSRQQAEVYARAWHELNPQVLVTEGVAVTGSDVEHIVTLTRE